jgi:hypothetical protein
MKTPDRYKPPMSYYDAKELYEAGAKYSIKEPKSTWVQRYIWPLAMPAILIGLILFVIAGYMLYGIIFVAIIKFVSYWWSH